MSNRVTLKDIAARAGVSQSTVSVFLKGRTDACSTETADRIRAAVAELNYKQRTHGGAELRGIPVAPSTGGGGVLATYDAPTTGAVGTLSPSFPSAAPPRLTRRSRNIGMIFSPDQDLLAPSEPYGSGTFRSDLIWRGIQQAAEWEDYGLLAYPSRIRESGSVESFLDGAAAGVILAANSPDPRAARLAAAGLPVLLLGWFQEIPDGCTAVYAYERDVVDLAMDHLWSLGHRRIAHFAGPRGDVAAERRDRYERWMRAHDAHDPALIQTSETWAGGDGGPERALTLWRELKEPPTAVFCAGDALALRLIQSAERQGLSIPGDLSVVGVGDTADALSREAESADGWSGRLTTVALPDELIGREAVRILLRMIDGVPASASRTAVPVTQLLVRETTAEPTSARR